MKKRLIIVVPGHKTLDRYPLYIQKIFLSFSKYLNIELPYHFGMLESYKNYFNSHGKVKVVSWNGTANSRSERKAKIILERIIDKNKDKDIIVVGLSLGGLIVLDALKESKYKVNKVILVGSINRVSKVPDYFPDIVNIYSKNDKLQKIAIEFLTLFKGNKKLLGKGVANVTLYNLTHNDICKNMKIKKGKFKGNTITEVIDKFLKN